MDTRITERYELIEENFQLLDKIFFTADPMNLIGSATAFANAGQRPDKDKIDECKKILNKNTGMFSGFRGSLEPLLLCKMAISGEAEAYLKDAIAVFDIFSKGAFLESSECVMAAMTIRDMNKVQEAAALDAKVRELQNYIKKNHGFEAHEHEFGYLLLLAMTGRTVEDILDNVGKNYHTLAEKLGLHNDSVYKLALVLEARGKNSTEDCEAVAEIFKAMSDNGVIFGKHHEMPALGLLAGLELDKNEIALNIKDME